MPSKTLLAALTADALIGTVLTFVGIQRVCVLAVGQMLIIFTYAMIMCLLVNDAVKVVLIKWRIPSAVAKAQVDLTPQISKRPMNCTRSAATKMGKRTQDWDQAEKEIRKDDFPIK